MTKRHKITFRILVFLAIGCFVYAVAILGFKLALSSEHDQTINAAMLASLWALGPPIWFWAERAIWETKDNKEELATGQDHARDFWLGLGAIVLFLADKRFS
jgi:hypothetical protein